MRRSSVLDFCHYPTSHSFPFSFNVRNGCTLSGGNSSYLYGTALNLPHFSSAVYFAEQTSSLEPLFPAALALSSHSSVPLQALPSPSQAMQCIVSLSGAIPMPAPSKLAS